MADALTRRIVFPQSTEEVAVLLRHANEQKTAVGIAGAGTKRGWGNPVDASMWLETSGLAGVREHRWQDLTATVAAGTTWAAMQSALAVHGQRVALDPLWPEKATVGGIIATNDSGSLRLRYGSLRDLIIGMTIVLADGTIAKSGGKVVKNVAGYDLHKLMIGAFGTLGFVTEVTFRLHPVPKSSATWSLAFADVESMDGLRGKLADSNLSIEALQMRTGGAGYFLDVQFACLPEALEDHARRLKVLALSLTDGVAGETVWVRREDVFNAEKATVKVTSSATQIAWVLAEIKAMGGSGIAQQTGIALASVDADATAIRGFRDKIEAAGGSLSVLHWPAGIEVRPDAWGSVGDSLPLMCAIKRQFDGNGILNPGCFVGGI